MIEGLKNFVEFLNSYPGWAKLLAFSGLLITIGTLIFAPRVQKPKEDGGEGRILLKLQRVRLFPSNPDAQVQVFAYVNGTEYKYPNIAGVKWLKVGPSMSPGIFEIPKSDEYEVRFEALQKDDTSSAPIRLVSMQVLQFSKLPYSGKYNLHISMKAVRSSSVVAAVDFKIEETK